MEHVNIWFYSDLMSFGIAQVQRKIVVYYVGSTSSAASYTSGIDVYVYCIYE